MPIPADLHRLAHAYGVSAGYYDLSGRRVHASADTLLAVLSALGAPVGGMGDVGPALRERDARRTRTLCEPVVVAWDGRVPTLELRLPGHAKSTVATASFRLEDGETREVHRDLEQLPIDRVGSSDGQQLVVRRWDTGQRLPLGYHQLRLSAAGQVAQVHVIAAPRRADTQAIDDTPARGGARAWGAFLPTYALRDDDDWGCGDYTRLGQLARWVADNGGRALATLPLLPGFLEEPLFEPSPYTPATRLGWNELFVDPLVEPEWNDARAARELVGSAPWIAERDALRGAELLDYERLSALKRPVLSAMAESLERRKGPRADVLAAFLAERPHLLDYARFRAATEARGEAWGRWPQQMRKGRLRDAELDPVAVRYHAYAQFLAHGQLHRIDRDVRDDDSGLMLDLPLGVHAWGYDTWRWPTLFARGMDAGAPPDPFFTRGQTWGFPPQIPQAMRQDGYRYYAATLRHHMEHARLLRIDHMMGLHRFYWVPHGTDASHGTYVHGHPQEQYAVLCLESHRAGTTLVGEDLGTVPRGVRPAMAHHGIQRLSVLQYAAGSGAPALSNRHAVAGLNTHDMPTFAAFCAGHDIDEFRSLGLFDGPTARRARERRRRVLGELRRWLEAEGHLAHDAPQEELVRACLAQLASSASPLLLVNLEDLWHETRPHNIPGTHRERPNWRRRALHGPARLAQLPEVKAALETVRSHRKSVRQAAPVDEATIFESLDHSLFRRGQHLRLHEKLGARPALIDDVPGMHAALWAPGAEDVQLLVGVDDEPGTYPMTPRGQGLWEVFVPGVRIGRRYAFGVRREGHEEILRDPFGRRFTTDDAAHSVLWDLDYPWGDDAWMRTRQEHARTPPRLLELSADDMTGGGVDDLYDRVLALTGPRGNAYVVLPAWNDPRGARAEAAGDFAPAHWLGTPQQVMGLVDRLHQRDIGVVLTWPPEGGSVDGRPPVPPTEARLTEVNEEDARGRAESYLLSCADFWMDVYHVDGLRITTKALRDRAGSANSLLQAAEILQRMQDELCERHPGALVQAGWRATEVRAAH